MPAATSIMGGPAPRCRPAARGAALAQRQPGGDSARLGGEPSIGTGPRRPAAGEAFISPIV